ncbi:MAG: rod shape-determining protein RodA [Flavobacteriales bacterium]|nr:rod shape-determining protein RodA [Flavobacteriales bacterium]
MHQEKNIKFDKLTVILYFTIVFIGWLSIYSSSYHETVSSMITINTIAGKQLFFILISILSSIFLLLIDVKIILRLSYIIYFINILSLILVLLIGKEVGGAKAWFKIGSFGLQPAEFAKLGTILVISKFINDKEIYLNSLKNLLIIISFIFIPSFLILLQPDAGSSLIYSALIIMFFREGLQLKYIISIITAGLLALATIIIGVNTTIKGLIIMTFILFIVLNKKPKKLMISLIFFISCSFIISSVNYTYENILESHQKERIDILIGKEKNKLGSGYNLNQSLIAIGSGGLMGKGFLKGTQTKGNFIPEQNTDFIFCTVGEEFGFIGSLTIILLFLALITRIIILSEKQYSRISRVFGYCLASILFAHVVINIGMTIGIVPVIGIPLPFLSYGGSSMLTFSIMLFLFIKLNSLKLERF